MICRIFSLGMLLALCASVQADYEKGLEAYLGGDFQTAFEEFRVLADQGIVVAQTNLGYMYTMGEGVETDLTQAYLWFRRAAEGKSSAAQVTVGSMLYHGEGVTADPVEAYAWFAVAATAGQQAADDFMLVLTSLLSSDQLSRARVLSETYYERYAVPSRVSLGEPG